MKLMCELYHCAIFAFRCASDLILPRACLACGRNLYLHEKHLCLYCLADLPLTHYWNRTHNPMADKLNEQIQKGVADGLDAGGTIPEPLRYSYAAALIFYHDSSPYKEILHNIKYNGNIEAGRHFGRMLGKHLAASDIYSDVDIIIPVPLHWSRRWKRGYNQAEEIASGVAAETGVPLRTDILYRRRRTTTQTKLDIEGKARNVAGAFALRKGSIPSDTMPRHILLIDDVFTTGSTLHACFVALREVFPAGVRISVATLGFVGGA